jgi:exodeoxyribonuclease-3
MGPARQAVKETFLELFGAKLKELRNCGRSFVIAGDFNVAHQPIDVYNPVRCSTISGFFPHERAWIDAVLTQDGWVDAFRVVNPEPQQFSWWSNFQNAFEHNRGWRIDYQLVTPDLRERVSSASVYKETRFSDHAPVIVEYEMNLR